MKVKVVEFTDWHWNYMVILSEGEEEFTGILADEAEIFPRPDGYAVEMYCADHFIGTVFGDELERTGSKPEPEIETLEEVER